MNPLIIILIICILIILVLVFFIVSIISSIRELNKQLDFIGENKTNMTISIGASTRSIRKLTDRINKVLVACRNREIETARKDDEIKETITSMSHDIRTPLTSLKGYFDLMCESDSEEDKDRYKGIIAERIDSLGEILISTLLSYFEDFERRGMTPDIDIDEDVFTVGDEPALKRVFQNLIKNSLNHGADSVTVRLKKAEGKKIKISVGNGIKDGQIPDVTRVFDRFYKGDKSRHVNSSGIGLSVTQKLIVLMGGSIEAVISDNMFFINIYLEELASVSKEA